MACAGLGNGVVFCFETLCADPVIYVTDEGNVTMKNHQSMPHAVMQARAVPAVELMGASRTDPVRRTMGGIAILALLLGAAGTEVAAISVHHDSGHAGAHLVSTGQTSERPWMY
jgi:hypothetical protein